jgi:CheY-like chemotaxis protein
LNIVERTARLLAHPFYLRSSLGQGTRFTLEVPTTAPELDSAPVQAIETPVTGSLRGLKVLVIEDDALASEGLAGLLESWECLVVSVVSAAAALKQLPLTGAPDVVISDYRLPDGANGIDAVSAVRHTAGHEIAACLISGDTDQALIAQAKEAGLTLLHKPVRPAKLRSLLRSLVRRDTGIG